MKYIIMIKIILIMTIMIIIIKIITIMIVIIIIIIIIMIATIINNAYISILLISPSASRRAHVSLKEDWNFSGKNC